MPGFRLYTKNGQLAEPDEEEIPVDEATVEAEAELVQALIDPYDSDIYFSPETGVVVHRLQVKSGLTSRLSTHYAVYRDSDAEPAALLRSLAEGVERLLDGGWYAAGENDPERNVKEDAQPRWIQQLADLPADGEGTRADTLLEVMLGGDHGRLRVGMSSHEAAVTALKRAHDAGGTIVVGQDVDEEYFDEVDLVLLYGDEYEDYEPLDDATEQAFEATRENYQERLLASGVESFLSTLEATAGAESELSVNDRVAAIEHAARSLDAVSVAGVPPEDRYDVSETAREAGESLAETVREAADGLKEARTAQLQEKVETELSDARTELLDSAVGAEMEDIEAAFESEAAGTDLTSSERLAALDVVARSLEGITVDDAPDSVDSVPTSAREVGESLVERIRDSGGKFDGSVAERFGDSVESWLGERRSDLVEEAVASAVDSFENELASTLDGEPLSPGDRLSALDGAVRELEWASLEDLPGEHAAEGEAEAASDAAKEAGESLATAARTAASDLDSEGADRFRAAVLERLGTEREALLEATVDSQREQLEESLSEAVDELHRRTGRPRAAIERDLLDDLRGEAGWSVEVWPPRLSVPNLSGGVLVGSLLAALAAGVLAGYLLSPQIASVEQTLAALYRRRTGTVQLVLVVAGVLVAGGLLFRQAGIGLGNVRQRLGRLAGGRSEDEPEASDDGGGSGEDSSGTGFSEAQFGVVVVVLLLVAAGAAVMGLPSQPAGGAGTDTPTATPTPTAMPTPTNGTASDGNSTNGTAPNTNQNRLDGPPSTAGGGTSPFAGRIAHTGLTPVRVAPVSAPQRVPLEGR